MDNIKSSLDCMRDGFQLVSYNGSNRGNPQLDLTTHLAVRTSSFMQPVYIILLLPSFAISFSLQHLVLLTRSILNCLLHTPPT